MERSVSNPDVPCERWYPQVTERMENHQTWLAVCEEEQWWLLNAFFLVFYQSSLRRLGFLMVLAQDIFRPTH